MFSLDNWQEIFDTIRSNKLRTFLTGFSVAWGIFMLVILLGSGNGLANGVEYQFRDDAINSIWIRSGQTSLPYQGLKPGRDVRFTNRDYDRIREEVDGVEHITARYFIEGNLVVSYRDESGSYNIRSVHPGHRYLEKTEIVAGRYLDRLDLEHYRKVAVVGVGVRDTLFGGADPIGEYLKVNGIAFKVVGVFEDAGGEGEEARIYLPITTAQRTFGGRDEVEQIMYTTGDASLEQSRRMAEESRLLLAARHRFAPDDPRAVFVRNNTEEFYRFQSLMRGIRLFVWIIGVGTLLAGVVGVSNILMIAVRERTKEIGVRKALGATPGSILGLVLQESVLITAVAGYVGLVLGVFLLEMVSASLPEAGVFRNPEVDLRVALWATALLVVAGTVAGYFPARKAARIRPIEALRDE
jgi:putative ABC transport system permease protein